MAPMARAPTTHPLCSPLWAAVSQRTDDSPCRSLAESVFSYKSACPGGFLERFRWLCIFSSYLRTYCQMV